MTDDGGKVGLWVQRHIGGLSGTRNVILAHSILAIYPPDWCYEHAFGKFVKDVRTPHCLGRFVCSEASSSLELWADSSVFTTEVVAEIVRRAFRDNRDEARYCGNPFLTVNGEPLGRIGRHA